MKSEFIDSRRSGRNTSPMTTENMHIVQRVLAELVATGEVDALEAALSEDFVHHRPDSTSRTKTEWLAAVRASPLADMRVDVQHLLSGDNYVVMHSLRRIPSAGLEIAGVDIWRFDDGLIAEAWEILEPASQAAAHLVWWEPAEH